MTIDKDTLAKIRQYYYALNYSVIQLSKRFNIPKAMIQAKVNEF